MDLLINIQKTIRAFNDRNAFFINGEFYKYSDLAKAISRIRKAIQDHTTESEKIIALIANGDLETYATIIALWFEGKAFVPISPETPRNRNEDILKQSFVITIVDSSEIPIFSEFNLIRSKKLADVEIDLNPKVVSEEELVFILFTSGTTGKPKGVPINRANLSAFVKAFEELNFDLNENDKFLQMFELTFDLSVMSYVIPILKGACIYTVPENKIKYSYIYELMEDHKLTFTLMVPSILQYLKPYFDEINMPDMKYSLFCGEALPLDIIEDWSRCLPNATIANVYGPTENTIFCTCYTYNRDGENKSHNGIISIGKAMKDNFTIIINDKDEILPSEHIGQLCLGGKQQTPGYWKNEDKNNESFFFTNYNNKKEKFYRTGDLCYCDENGDIMYLGRTDFQTKIQGFRVELFEVEFHIKKFMKKINVVAVAYSDLIGNAELGIAIEGEEFDLTALHGYMKKMMPLYMIPKKIIFVDVFPLNTNGKTDRNKLATLLTNN